MLFAPTGSFSKSLPLLVSLLACLSPYPDGQTQLHPQALDL